VSDGQRRAGERGEGDRVGHSLALEIDRRLHDLAMLACAALPASACALGWRLGPDAGSACAPLAGVGGSTRGVAAMLEPLGRLIEREVRSAVPHGKISRILDPSEMAALGAGASASAAGGIFGGLYSDGEAAICAAVAVAAETPMSEVRALLELVGKAALREVGTVNLTASHDFWRTRAARGSARDAALQREAAQNSALVADLLKLSEPERFSTMAGRIAAAIGCDRWLVALHDGARLRFEVSSPPLRTSGPEEFSPEFARSVRENRAALGESATHPGNPIENRVLGDSWTAIPFDGGVLGLGGAIEPEARAKVEMMLSAAAPLLRAWIAERRLGEHRALVQRMALRMYAAIDDERARIARDLHDDQGQLLAAARIALQGKPETARIIFEKLERELRTRTRGLRPATPGKLSLAAALEGELARMRETGLAARLSIGPEIEKVSPPVQQLCFQVAREALTNVIRHAGASTVTVRIERASDVVRIEIADNGHGIPSPPETRSSMGLAGVTERLELMGGKLKVESGRSGTRLVAEVPEPV
jgi:signal transduction histidine kinase